MNDSELDQLLNLATTGVPPHAGFQREVWQCIEAAEAKRWKPRLGLLAEWFFGFLALPRVAIATCTAVAMAGAWIGQQTATPSASHEASYVESISPFAQSHR